jgi:cation diffusion facilitator CzcD-associated flavoprotein CzcO
VLREKLRPSYRAACKRLVISANFYEAIQQPNAELVTEGIERVEPTGIRTDDGGLPSPSPGRRQTPLIREQPPKLRSERTCGLVVGATGFEPVTSAV